MLKDFILPDIGEGIVECELVEWLVNEGDTIVEDQAVAEVMTDKAMVQIPAMDNGVITKHYYNKGDIAKVHSPLFQVEVAGGEATAAAPVATEEQSAPAAAEATPAPASAGVEDFILPDIGEGIVECELVEWLISEGDTVKEDQPVAEVMTDKAMVQIPAKHDGTIVKLHYAKGDIAKVHSPLYAIAVDGAVATAPVAAKAEAAPQAKPAQSNAGQSEPAKPARQGKAIASPAVRRLAREMNIDISAVQGSGKKGRVMKDDLHNFKAGNQVAATTAVAAPQVQAENRVEPIKGVKAAMAKQMQLSVSTIPHMTCTDEVDMTALIQVRAQLKEKLAKKDIKLSFMPFFMKAMSLAIKEFPVVNSQPNDDCTELTYFNSHNIGMAVDSKIGLLVPNVKNVQDLTIEEIAVEMNRITDAAREGRVSPDDLKGGTISISNIGAIGGLYATPIINKPEVAIVALGKTQQLPRFDAEGNVTAANIMPISWSADHRILDGATLVRFSNLWKHYLEQPLEMLTSLK